MVEALPHTKMHLAEMLLDLKYRGPADQLRRRHPFSEDIEATHAILFSNRYDKRRKIRAYRQWLETYQPCVFGRVAAKNKNVFICLIEEHEVLRMRNGDDDLRDTIQDYRQAWKRHALEGLRSSFLILLVSKSIVEKEPGDRLKEIARRLLELYMEIEIKDNDIVNQREYVFLRRTNKGDLPHILKFSTLPNIFCAQGDGRWWRDHRTPGGLMITSNALGHFAYSRPGTMALQDKDRLLALENAMRTISHAYRDPANKKSGKFRHCPATRLVPLSQDETSPLRDSSEFRKFSADHYEGYFNTDHLIPSVFFTRERDPKQLSLYDNLPFRYIFDPVADPKDHAELMTGIESTWYEVRRNIDRLPDYVNPETIGDFSDVLRARLANWLLNRLKTRIEG
jgi:hypothetical protein